MKIWYLIILVIVMLMAVLLGGCRSGIVFEDIAPLMTDVAATKSELVAAKSELAAANSALAEAQNRIETLESEIAILSSISAYNIWYDQYYTVGYYEFKDVISFNEKFGAIIEATDDSNSIVAWKAYLVANEELNTLAKTLAEDYSLWSMDEYRLWYEVATGRPRLDALGNVGTALHDAIVNQ